MNWRITKLGTWMSGVFTTIGMLLTFSFFDLIELTSPYLIAYTVLMPVVASGLALLLKPRYPVHYVFGNASGAGIMAVLSLAGFLTQVPNTLPDFLPVLLLIIVLLFGHEWLADMVAAFMTKLYRRNNEYD